MTAELPEGLLLEDKNNWIRTIKTSLAHISTIENCKKEDEYYRIYQNTTIFKFQIIDIDLGGTEREGSEIAASIAENRQKRGKKLSPIILISAYQTGLDKAKNDPLISKYFDYL